MGFRPLILYVRRRVAVCKFVLIVVQVVLNFLVQPISLQAAQTLSTVEEKLSMLRVRLMLWRRPSRLVSYLFPPTNFNLVSDVYEQVYLSIFIAQCFNVCLQKSLMVMPCSQKL